LDKDFIGAGVAIIMDNSLAYYVSKVEEVSGRVVSIQLLFKGKLSVTLLGLYAGASSGGRFGQVSEVNSLIAKAVNSSIHVVLGEDFNENGSGRSSNSKGVVKTIDYIFVSGNLFFAVIGHQTVLVSDFFDTNHKAVMVSIGLGGLLNAKFRDLSLAKLLLLGDMFSGAEVCGDKAVLGSANEMFSRHWFSKFKCLKNKHSSKFFGLELLVAKIVKKFCSSGLSDVNFLVSKWLTLDNVKACAFRNLVSLNVKFDVVVKHLSLVRKDYRRAKMFESRFAEETSIRKAIDRHMENFCSDKGSMIRSILDRPFYKVVLDHLVVDNKLVLEPEKVKVSVDKIMKGWTKKQSVHVYAPLSYVWNDAFSGVMCKVAISELLFVISGMLNGKAAGLSGISNEL
ncbi:hypothetical protein G9A89_015352, partial [Geosiphon pyriformis]